MEIRLAYGEKGMLVDLPDGHTTIVEPAWRPASADPGGAIREAIARPIAGAPLRELVRAGQKVAISVCDGTRAQPRHLMVPAVLDALEGIVDPDDIVVVVATGTHRGNSPAELEAMFGPDVLERVRVVNHDCRDDASLRWMGTFGAAVPVWLNKEWADADVRITTGFVEPHFFAGFSGGPKMVAPGLAGLETVLTLHNAARIGHPKATWGITEGNPIHDDVRAIAAAVGVTFACDVVLNRDQEVVAAFAGSLFPMHAAACALAKEVAMQAVPAPFDVVVTTNSGFPLDQNLYQVVKGVSAAAQIVKPGGTIVAAAECRDGFPDHGSFRSFLSSEPSIEALLQRIESAPSVTPDQWQVQVQALVQAKANIVVCTDGLTAADLASAHLGYTDNVTATVAGIVDRLGPGATVCALPEGPQTIPYLAA